MALRERGDGARQTRGRREEGRGVVVRMTCVGGVREEDERRNCYGATMNATNRNATRANLRSVSLRHRGGIAPPCFCGHSWCSLITRGPAATRLHVRTQINHSWSTKKCPFSNGRLSPQPLAVESIAKRTSTLNIALSCRRGARSQCTQQRRCIRRRERAAGGRGWQEAGRRCGPGGLTKGFWEQPSRGGRCQRARCCGRRVRCGGGSGSVT